MNARWRTCLLLLGLCFLTGCGLQQLRGVAPTPNTALLPDTSAQQALVREYVGDVAAGQYADAWKLLAPVRQRRESVQQFAEQWRQRGAIGPTGRDFLVWPAAIDEVRAQVWLDQSHGGDRETIRFTLANVDDRWRVANEQEVRPLAEATPEPLPTSPEDLARRLVAADYGSLYLLTFRVLDDEQFDGGRILIFGFLDPLLEPAQPEPRTAAMLLFVRPENGGWVTAGGGLIGTVSELGRWTVGCAWTWIHLATWEPRNLPQTAAFYCTVEDPRIAAVEIQRVDGGVQRVQVDGRQAVVFPYVWDSPTKLWPPQHPTSIRLFDSKGQPLDLSACCTVAQVRQFELATRTAP